MDQGAGTAGTYTIDADGSISLDSDTGLIYFQDSGATSLYIDIPNVALVPSTDNAFDLGTTSNRFRNIYTGDLHLKNERGDWSVVEESEYLSLTNNKTGKKYRLLMEEVDEDGPETTEPEETITTSSKKSSGKKKRSL